MTNLKNYIQEGEHVSQDFKMRIDDQRKIARTLAAFANTDGGRLLVGVKDNGKITGIHPEEEFHMIQGAASLFCSPAIPLQTKIWQEDMRLVLEVIIEENPKRFVKAKDDENNWTYYIRIKDETLKANKIQLKLWKLEVQKIEKPLIFKQQELDCLKVLSENTEGITISKLYKLLTHPKKDIENSLALLIHWKMVYMEYTKDTYIYHSNNC